MFAELALCKGVAICISLVAHDLAQDQSSPACPVMDDLDQAEDALMGFMSPPPASVGSEGMLSATMHEPMLSLSMLVLGISTLADVGYEL